MPIGPTGKISAAVRPWSRVCLIAVAISWPIMTSKSATESQATGSKPRMPPGLALADRLGRMRAAGVDLGEVPAAREKPFHHRAGEGRE